MIATNGASCPSEPPVRLGTLIRHVPLRLLEVDSAGCLFASPASIEVGTIGRLEVTLRNGQRVHAVRVCRSVRRNGRAWPYSVAAQLLILGAPAASPPGPSAGGPEPGDDTTRRRSTGRAKDGLHE
jgi:hypothetical protein